MALEIKHQMLNPKIRIVSSSNIKQYAASAGNNFFSTQAADYIEIGGRIEPSSKYYLMSYQFSESVNNFSGSFSVSIYEDIDSSSPECIFSKVKNLDIVFIFEDSQLGEKGLESKKPVFIGVVHQKSMRSIMNNGKVSRITTLDGNGIYSLIGDLSVSFDIHTLTGVDAATVQKQFTEKTKSLKTYPEIINSLWDSFLEISKKVATEGKLNTTSIYIADIIASFYFGAFAKIFQFENLSMTLYPVVANFWTQSVNNFSDMLRTLLPSNVFEIFGRVDDKGRPVLVIREVPFSPETWSKLNSPKAIDPVYLTGYSIQQSDSEVYNAFLAYIEGSNQDPSFSATLAAIENRIAKDTDKMAKYGYRPLQVNFRGYNTSQDFSKDKDPKEAIKQCSDKMKDWYGALDELYTGTISLVRGEGDNLPQIGERIKFIDYEFYVTDKSHSWSYGNPINVTLNISRGAYYNKAGKRDTSNILSREKFGTRFAELQKFKI